MSADSPGEAAIGAVMKVARTGQVAKVVSVDDKWERIFPHKGPMIVLDIDSGRRCYSRCELDLAEQDLPRVPGAQAEFH